MQLLFEGGDYLKKCGILLSSNTSKTECMIRSNNHLLDHCLSKFTLGKQKEVGRWVLLPNAGVGSWSVITLTHTQQNWHMFKVQRPTQKKSGAAWISPATLLLTAVADMYVTNGTVLHRWYTHSFSTCAVANYVERLSSNSAWAWLKMPLYIIQQNQSLRNLLEAIDFSVFHTRMSRF